MILIIHRSWLVKGLVRLPYTWVRCPFKKGIKEYTLRYGASELMSVRYLND